MAEPFSFHARSIHAISPDRIYRVELSGEVMYFLRIGGQFDLDRLEHQGHGAGQVAAAMLLTVGEAMFRQHKREELLARDPNQHPETLLCLHPHNFKLRPVDIKRATFLPRKWLLSLFRRHYGRLVVELMNDERWEFHFESSDDLRTALERLPKMLGPKLTKNLVWDQQRQRFTRPDQ